MTGKHQFLTCVTTSEFRQLHAVQSIDGHAQKQFMFQTASRNAITNKERFFEAANHSLPLNPANVTHVWDALEDSLFGGLVGLRSPSVAIFWPFADQVLYVFLAEGIKFFKDVADMVGASQDDANSKPVQLKLFLICSNEKSKQKLAAEFWAFL